MSARNLVDPDKINHFQHIAVEESRLHIPILFAFDTIHGYRTIFPIPLGAASSFDPAVATADDTVAARETATVGLKQIYSPMVDLSHEPRWGRIAEGGGEDPYLGSVFAAAGVKAAQGSDYSASDKVVTSVKHLAAYGQPEGGREYNTTDMSEQRLRNFYLPPFKAAVDAGADAMNRLDDAVRRILRVKFRAGLFEHPYVDTTKAKDPSSFLTDDDRAAALNAASRSMVLLKNDGGALPLDPSKSVALIGPLGDDQHDMLGPWWGQGRDEDAVSLFTGMKKQDANTTFTPGCAMVDKDPPLLTPADECGSAEGFGAAVTAAGNADQIVLALGETRGQSGEAAARTEIDLPGKQQELIDQIAALHKPFVVVLFNGRPLTLSKVDAAAPAILEAWFPGVEAGNAVADVLFGKVNPGASCRCPSRACSVRCRSITTRSPRGAPAT